MSSSSPASGWRLGSEDGARISHLQVFSSQGQIKNHLSHAEAREFACLGREKDRELLFAGLDTFAHRLQGSGKTALAAEIYRAIGRESRSGFAETWLVSLTKTATDYRLILPMLAGSTLYQTTRTMALSRLLTAPSANALTRGFGARTASSLLATTIEIPSFTFLHHGLRSPNEGGELGHEMASASIMLGTMKLTGWAGSLVSPKMNFAASFAGLLAAHKMEVTLGLRDPTDASTTLINSLGTLLSLKVGESLGQRILGPGFFKFQNDLATRESPSTPREARPVDFWKFPGGRFSALANLVPEVAPGFSSGFGIAAAPPRLRPILSENRSKDTPDSGSSLPAGSGETTALAVVSDFKLETLEVYHGDPPEKIPGARLIKLDGHRILNFRPLRLGKEALLTAAAIAAFPLPTALGILGARYLIRKLAPQLYYRILQLKADVQGSNKFRLLARSPWNSATFREDPLLLERAEEIRARNFKKAMARAGQMEMDFPLYLSRMLRGAEPLELEAWLMALYPDFSSVKMKWIRLSRNPAGVPLLLDIAQDRSIHISWRKEAINTLAELKVADGLPVFLSLISDPYLNFAAAGAALSLNSDLTGHNEIHNQVPIPTERQGNFSTWTESFYDFRHRFRGAAESIDIPDYLHSLEKEARLRPGDWTLASHLTYNEDIPVRLFPDLSRRYERHIFRPLVLETLLDAGFRDLVGLRIAVDFRQENPDLSFAFLDGEKKTSLRDWEPEVLIRWARVAGKLGFTEEAKKFLIWQERKLRRSTEPDPQTLLSLGAAYVTIGNFRRAVPLLKPLLRRQQEMNIPFQAADLLDQAQPGWDEDLKNER